MKTKLRHPIFLALHGAAILGLLLLPLYIKLATVLSGVFGGCIMHRLFIYCPLCGGTRALSEIARFDFAAAWNHNALVVVLFAVLLGLDVWAWIRYFQKKEPLVILPKWSWIAFGAAFGIYFILRNCLMIFFGVDPTGDLGYFWEAIRAYRG